MNQSNKAGQPAAEIGEGTAGRCVGCDECTRACPAGIDLGLLNLAMAEVADRQFEYRAGIDPAAEPPVGSFAVEDREEFIR